MNVGLHRHHEAWKEEEGEILEGIHLYKILKGAGVIGHCCDVGLARRRELLQKP
jgi:hypothetical protein